MPLDDGASAPKLERIVVSPERRRLTPGQKQQLRVTAEYSDGRAVDVTRLARVPIERRRPRRRGRRRAGCEALDGVGEAAIMALFGGHVSVARATIPLTGEIPAWQPPATRNFIDPLVFGKLKELNLPAIRN